MTVSAYLRRNFRHFNAAALVDAADAWRKHIDDDGHMMVTLGGAMSTAELGISLAALIREGKVHSVTCTGANLEEDVFNLVAHTKYVRIREYHDLSPENELQLLENGLNRVTDTCIPEKAAMERVEEPILDLFRQALKAGVTGTPAEYLKALLLSGDLKPHYEIDPRNSWLLAAAEARIPVWTPGWEDSTLGNMCVGAKMRGELESFDFIKSGLEQMIEICEWYRSTDPVHRCGFFQVGGGISGDYPICAVPLLRYDARYPKTRTWAYFAQISEAKTSFGSYSGAMPNEKITWGKLDPDTPRFVIESDATIVFPLVAALVLGE